MKPLTTRCHTCQIENQDTELCDACKSPLHYFFNGRQPRYHFPETFVQRLFIGVCGEKDFYQEIQECVEFIEKFSRFRLSTSVHRLPELSHITKEDVLWTKSYMATAEDADLRSQSDGDLTTLLWKLLPGQKPSFTGATWGHELGGIGEYRPYSSIPYNVWWWNAPNEGWRIFGAGIMAQALVNQIADIFEEIGSPLPPAGTKKHPVSSASYELQKKRLQSITPEMYEVLSTHVLLAGNVH